MHPRTPFVLVTALCFFETPLGAQSPGFWEPRPSLRFARQEVGAALLDGKLYVVGGIGATRSVEVYDPKTGRWSLAAPLPTGTHHMAVAAALGKLYVMGGTGAGARTQVYDPRSNRWSRAADMPQARSQMVGVTIADKIYVVGGVAPSRGTVADLTVYDPRTNRWRSLPPMPTPRNHLGAAALGGKLYVVGGRSPLRNNLEVYDPSTNQWNRLPPMPTARGGTGAATLQGKLVVMGGEGNRSRPDGIFPQTEEYDPRTRRWRKLRDMTPAMHGIYPVTMGDEIVVAGGATKQGLGAVRTVVAFRYLPDGVHAYGVSTPACRGPVTIFPNEPPVAGRTGFTLLSSPDAPPGAAGVLAVGARPDRPGSLLLGARMHLDLAAPLALAEVVVDSRGLARVPAPLPADAKGRQVFLQYVFANTPTCAGPGALSASHGLDLTVR